MNKEKINFKNPEDDYLERELKRLVALGVIASSLLGSQGCAPEKSGDNDSRAKKQLEPGSTNIAVDAQEKNLTAQEVQQFWTNQLSVVRKLMEDDEYPLPEIKTRYHKLKEDISKRYGKGIEFLVTVNYCPISKEVVGAAVVTKDGPRLGIFTPALMDIWNRLEKSSEPKWKEAFDNTALVALMHEMDHLASGYVLTPDDKDASIDGRVFREKHAWALTCEYTLKPLVESGQALTYSEQIRYDAWVQGGRNVDSPFWEEHVRGLHQSIGEQR